MSDIQKKIKAVRNLCGLTQSTVARRAHLHVKTYQRLEAGRSPVTDDLLEIFAVIFKCPADGIRRFDLENNHFEPLLQTSPEVDQLHIENAFLKAENVYLKELLRNFMGDVPDFSKAGGQEMNGGDS